MPELNVPASGLLLNGSHSHSLADLPPQTFFLSLTSTVIQDLIDHVQNGGDIDLSLGTSPGLLYGAKTHRILQPPESSGSLDLFLTRPYERTRLAQRLPNAIAMAPRNPSHFMPSNRPVKASDRVKIRRPPKTPATEPLPMSSPPKLDSDIEQLQNSMAAAGASRNQSITLTRDVPTKKKGPAQKGKAPLGRKTLPISPSARAQQSPQSSAKSAAQPSAKPIAQKSSPPLVPQQSASQLKTERLREQRVMIVHELAVQERSHDYLREKWTGTDDEFTRILEKAADLNSDTKSYAIKKLFWKELDVWEYKYDSDADRQTAIDNAIKQYDRLRLGASEPEWQKLLRKEERGMGICPSLLLEKLARGSVLATATASALVPAPKIKVQSPPGAATGGTSSAKDRDGTAKKTGASDSQTKRLLPKSKKPTTPRSGAAAAAPPTKSRDKSIAPSPSTAAASNSVAAAKDKAGKPSLSAEFVLNSDSDSDGVSKAGKSEQPPKRKQGSAASASSTAAPASAGSSSVGSRSRLVVKSPAHAKPMTNSKSPANSKYLEHTKSPAHSKPPTQTKASVYIKSPALTKSPARSKIWQQTTSPAYSKSSAQPSPAQPAKRRRSVGEDDDMAEDDSASSGTPPNKRARKAAPTNAAKPAAPTRPHLSDNSQSSRVSSSGTASAAIGLGSGKRNMSPSKSSPLASPPINMSCLEQEQERGQEREGEDQRESQLGVHHEGSLEVNREGSREVKREVSHEVKREEDSDNNLKRRRPAEPVDASPRPTKRPVLSAAMLPHKLVVKAVEFRTFYEKYESLHNRLSGMSNPRPDDLMEDLHGMHNQLAGLKEEIYRECAELGA